VTKEKSRVAVLHYSAHPVVGGVESVILSHVRLLLKAGFPVRVIVGRGETSKALQGAEFYKISELDSQHPAVLEVSQELEQGRVPLQFDDMVTRLEKDLSAALDHTDIVIVHNTFTKHFNLPLTAALFRLLDQNILPKCIAWCHDISWTSPNSRSKVFPAYPWDLLRTFRPDIAYVAVSEGRKQDLVQLFGCPPDDIQVIYNGVDPMELLALSQAGQSLSDRLGLWESDLNLLLPVRVTQAKNIEFAIKVVAALIGNGVQPRLIVTGPPDPHDRLNMEYFQSLLKLREQLDVVTEVCFVYESGPFPGEPYSLSMQMVSELFRMSDALFMPSHREGFGMPILEAGLAGIPVFCSDRIPAAKEIGGPDVFQFSLEAKPDQVANLILEWMKTSPTLHLRRHIRQSLTWESIFHKQIVPLLDDRLPWTE
jgi:mannosylglucosylglycerate synthase